VSDRLPPPVNSCQLPIEDSFLHYLEIGTGDPVLFLHGNPTSSALWRNVLGPVAATGRRCLALDLIGMGRSGKPDSGYRLVDHIRYVDAFIDALGRDDLTIVGHDWGAVIGLDQARRRPDRIRGVAFLEGHLHPIERWTDLDEGGRDMFQRLRTRGVGEQMVIEDNFFVEAVLPAGTMRTLTEVELDAYREPFREPASRWPTLVWPREIPIEGEPADVVERVLANQEVIADPAMPTLLLYATPGAVITATDVAWCKEHGAALSVADLGAGTHFLPEDRPDEIVAHLCRWLDELDELDR
jgi:haloalkane dehalogenase